MSEITKTRAGSMMKIAVRNKVIAVMTDPANDGDPQAIIAKKVGVSVRTLRNYLTDEVWDKIKALRLDVMSGALADVDRAVFAKAMQGNISAAKMIYSRWEQLKESRDEVLVDPKTLEDIEREVKALREEIQSLEKEGGK